MPEAFSFNREFDFVRLDGLSRVTGRTAHEWDIYIIKELIDNALDADEILWTEDTSAFPMIHIKAEYIDLIDGRRQLIVQVANRAVFPAELIESVFDPGWYTSRKAFVKGLTRGSLGNALKTLLGIPYALRRRAAGDMSPELKPLSIQCGGKEYLPRYIVDSASQVINLEIEVKETKKTQGTIFRIGIDHYGQEIPRQPEHLQELAEQYHWCNPHTEFNWEIEMEGHTYNAQYFADLDWKNKYQGIAPVQWYTPTAFQDLMNALYRKQFGDNKNGSLPIDKILSSFDRNEGKENPDLKSIITRRFKKETLSLHDIGASSTNLHRILFQYLSSFDAANLGGIGENYLRSCLNQKFNVDDSILYTSLSDGNDPNAPFVLEICVARLKKGKREIWTAINFTPTYGDPFFRRQLDVPAKPENPVLGIRGLLDAYGFVEDTPVIVYMHLICPSIEHAEYSKTEINHLPFKDALANTFDHLLNQLINAERDKELQIERVIYSALDEILEALRPDERFVADQLLEKLRTRLGREAELKQWMDTPGVLERLRSYIAKYQSVKPVVTHWARPSSEVTIPSHPDRHFSIPVEQVTSELLKTHHVNKMLYVHAKEIEPVVIENGWLCQMDMALLRDPPDLESVIVHCLSNINYPLLILHNADDSGKDVVNRVRNVLAKRHMQSSRIIDLGLSESNNQVNGGQSHRLVQFMPNELAEWITVRLDELGIPKKALPDDADIRKDIRSQFEKLLLRHLWEGMSQHLQIVNLLHEIDQTFDISYIMQEHKLDLQLQEKMLSNLCKESYDIAMKELINQFYMVFMSKNEGPLRSIVQSHLKKYLPLTKG